MLSITEEELADLIACPKAVVDPPRREMKLEGKMKRNEIRGRKT